jgi:hypothetical protein
MQAHIDDLNTIKQMVLDKNLKDKDLEETITETIEGCIINAESYLELEKNQAKYSYNQGGMLAFEVGSEDYFNKKYLQNNTHD